MDSTKPIDRSNENLFLLIPVIYGAVFSYAMYIFSMIINAAYKEWHPLTFNAILHTDGLKKICLFFAFTIFMIEDVGSMMKIGFKYPFIKTSRYTFEIFISLLYVCTFSLLGEDNYYCTISFTGLIIFAAVWHNQFKEEYRSDNSNVADYSRNERDLHYVLSLVLVLESGIFLWLRQFGMQWVNVIVFISTVFAWMYISAKWVCMRHGENILKCKVMVFVSDSYVKKICNKKTTLLD